MTGSINTLVALSRWGLKCLQLSQPGAPSFAASAVRGYGSRAAAWGEVFQLQQGKAWNEMKVVSNFLPNRKAIGVQFNPHGISLVPRAILSPPAPGGAPGGSSGPSVNEALAAEMTAKMTSLRADLQAARVRLNMLEETFNEESRVMPEVMQMGDKTREWRRLKIKKHKVNKRRKSNRFKVKPK